MHLAALRGNVRAAKAAIELGASPETRDGQARRPIELVKEKLLKARQEQGKLAALSRRRGSDEPDMPDVDTALFVKHMEVEHLLQPTWRSRIAAYASAPIPAPPTSGHCRLRAATPCARHERACASRHALPAA